jgi:hypothetical protein
MTKLDFVEAYARHILPARLRRFRFAGLFRPTGRNDRLTRCRELLGSSRHEPASTSTTSHDISSSMPPISIDTQEHLPVEEQTDIKHGLFCSKCEQRMRRVIEIDGSMSCWTLKIALLDVAYLKQHRISTLALSVDIEMIQTALQQVIHRLQAEANIDESATSREWIRYAHVTPSDMYFHAAYYDVLLLFVAQQIAEQNAAEERLAEAMLRPTHHAARCPPKHTDFKKSWGSPGAKPSPIHPEQTHTTALSWLAKCSRFQFANHQAWSGLLSNFELLTSNFCRSHSVIFANSASHTILAEPHGASLCPDVFSAVGSTVPWTVGLNSW